VSERPLYTIISPVLTTKACNFLLKSRYLKTNLARGKSALPSKVVFQVLLGVAGFARPKLVYGVS
jgi:hypothetical protein